MQAAELNAYIAKTPFFRFLKMQVLSNSGDKIETAMPFEERFVGNPILKNFHGGIIASYLEASASLLILDLPVEGLPKPINLTVDYLRPAGPKPLNAHAHIFRSGRRMASIEALAWQENRNKPVAKGLFHFLLV